MVRWRWEGEESDNWCEGERMNNTQLYDGFQDQQEDENSFYMVFNYIGFLFVCSEIKNFEG